MSFGKLQFSSSNPSPDQALTFWPKRINSFAPLSISSIASFKIWPAGLEISTPLV